MTEQYVPTYIKRLDEFLGGGFPRKAISLVSGNLDIVKQCVDISGRAGKVVVWLKSSAGVPNLMTLLEQADLVLISDIGRFLPPPPPDSGPAAGTLAVSRLGREIQRNLYDSPEGPAVILVNPPQTLELSYLSSLTLDILPNRSAPSVLDVVVKKNRDGNQGAIILGPDEYKLNIAFPPDPTPLKSAWERLVDGIGL